MVTHCNSSGPCALHSNFLFHSKNWHFVNLFAFPLGVDESFDQLGSLHSAHSGPAQVSRRIASSKKRRNDAPGYSCVKVFSSCVCVICATELSSVYSVLTLWQRGEVKDTHDTVLLTKHLLQQSLCTINKRLLVVISLVELNFLKGAGNIKE